MSIDEQVETLTRQVRELARLHGELARVELRAGARRLVTTLCLLGFGVIVGVLVLVAAGVALFFLLSKSLSPAAAAALVALVYLVIVVGAWLLAWRLMQAAGALFLPRTRQMFSELLQWRTKPTDS